MKQGDSNSVLVLLQAYSLDGVSESLKKAYKLFTDGKFSNALQAFNQMLWTIPLVVVATRKEVDEVKELITICRHARPPPACCSHSLAPWGATVPAMHTFTYNCDHACANLFGG